MKKQVTAPVNPITPLGLEFKKMKIVFKTTKVRLNTILRILFVFWGLVLYFSGRAVMICCLVT